MQDKINQANSKLEKVRIFKRGKTLSLRATLPPKPGDGNKNKQYTMSVRYRDEKRVVEWNLADKIMPRTPIQYSKTRRYLLLRKVFLGRLEIAEAKHEDYEQPPCDAGQISFFSLRDNVLCHLASDQYEINYVQQ